MKAISFLLPLLLAIFCPNALAHQGRTDQGGGHDDHVHGGHHYHAVTLNGVAYGLDGEMTLAEKTKIEKKFEEIVKESFGKGIYHLETRSGKKYICNILGFARRDLRIEGMVQGEGIETDFHTIKKADLTSAISKKAAKEIRKQSALLAKVRREDKRKQNYRKQMQHMEYVRRQANAGRPEGDHAFSGMNQLAIDTYRLGLRQRMDRQYFKSLIGDTTPAYIR